MHYATKIVLPLCGLLVVLLMTSSVVSGGTINYKPASERVVDNNFSGNGKNDQGPAAGKVSAGADSGQLASDSGESVLVLNLKRNVGQNNDTDISSIPVVQNDGSTGSGQDGEMPCLPKSVAHQTIPERAICPFKIVDDVDEKREPWKLYVAEATNSDNHCLDPNYPNGQIEATAGQCELVYYDVAIERLDNTGRMRPCSQRIAVARVCVKDTQ